LSCRSGKRCSRRYSSIPSLVSLYHALPPGLRSLAASLHGRRLSALRYGADCDRLADEAIARETWSPVRWKGWQSERLALILRNASAGVPYYRQWWEQRRARGNEASPAVLGDWPVLKKDSLRQNPTAFVADGYAIRKMYSEYTSGTTGTPVHLWHSRDTVRSWYALCEARWHRWYGLTRQDRWANIGGQVIIPVAQRKPPFWVWNGPMHQLYMSSYHLAADLAPFYIEAMEKYRVRYLLGYTSSLCSLAQAAKEEGCRLKLDVVLTNAEPLYAHQRELIAEAFQCPVHETYGMSETVSAASECVAGRLHIWPDAGFIEILDWDSDRAVPPGTTGRIVATGLINPEMPLVRYETGDSGALDPDDAPCECGRTLPRLLCIEGRNDDILWTRDGRPIGRLDPVFKAGLHIKEAQVVQESIDRVVVRLVPLDGYTSADEVQITSRLKERMGSIEVAFERLPSIPRERNGKFRAVVCRLDTGEKRRLLRR
jgi:phenylacetate-CoA ligase